MNRAILGTILAATLLAALPTPDALACLWDDDTLAAEAQGLPPVPQIVTGRFERNPAKYYEMRLARVAAELAESPDDLAGYDNAGVACDRLGRGDEAVRWMERKHERLVAAGPEAADLREHRYRYHANLGTFLAHRWFRGGKDRADLTDLRAGRDHIARAIEINPEAHFGRERYQLAALDWVIEGTPLDQKARVLPDLLGLSANPGHASVPGGLAERGHADAVEGLTGLMALGAAWESVDVLNSLAFALEVDGRNALARVVRLRLAELAGAGKSSIVPGTPTGARLAKLLESQRGFLREAATKEIDAWYAAARKEADRWSAERLRYMETKFASGSHPDTDPEFWSGYRPTTKAPALPDREYEGGPTRSRGEVEQKSKKSSPEEAKEESQWGGK